MIFSRAAISFAETQNGSSRLTLVLRPATTIERFVIRLFIGVSFLRLQSDLDKFVLFGCVAAF